MSGLRLKEDILFGGEKSPLGAGSRHALLAFELPIGADMMRPPGAFDRARCLTPARSQRPQVCPAPN